MRKRILAVLLVAALFFGLAACVGGSSAGSTSGEGDGPATVKVGVSIYKFDDNFMTLYRTELERYMEEDLSNDSIVYDVTVVDAKGDETEQASQVDQFIADGYDVLIVNLVNDEAAAPIIDKAKTAGIPVVFINRQPNVAGDMEIWPGYTTYVGADAKQSGTYEGEIIVETDNQGDFNGDGVVSYIMIMGDEGNTDAEYRTEYSIKALTDAGLTVELLDEQRGHWQQTEGYEITAANLTKFGDKLEVVFCNNDAMALGAMEAIEAAGRVVGEDIYLVGVDALAEAVTAIEEGRMTGTVLNDHNGQSHKAADVAAELAAGGTVDTFYWVDYQKVSGD